MTDDNSYSDLGLRDRLSKKFADLGIDGRIDLLLMFYADNKYKTRITDEQQQILDSGYYPRLLPVGGDEDKDIEERKYHNEDDLKSETLQIMVEENLVRCFNEIGLLNYSPTSLGYRINERGGWKVHVDREETNRTVASTLIASNINTNRFIRWTLFAVAISAILQFISIVVTHKDAVAQREQSPQVLVEPQSGKPT